MPIGWGRKKEHQAAVPEVLSVDARAQALLDQSVPEGQRWYTAFFKVVLIVEGAVLRVGPVPITVQSVELDKLGGIIHTVDGVEVAFRYAGGDKSFVKVHCLQDQNRQR